MTKLDVECIHQAIYTASVDIDSTLLHRPTAAGFYTYVHGQALTPGAQPTMSLFGGFTFRRSGNFVGIESVSAVRYPFDPYKYIRRAMGLIL